MERKANSVSRENNAVSNKARILPQAHNLLGKPIRINFLQQVHSSTLVPCL